MNKLSFLPHRRAVSFFMTALLVIAGSAAAETVPSLLIGGVTPSETLRLGEKMYREGILPSGKPMQAMVQGDIPVDGSQFTCANCHQRSGVGSEEGLVRTPPVDGARLYAPRSVFKGIPVRKGIGSYTKDDFYRPAYTDETLTKAILTGEDPAGRQMGTAMPRYFLDGRDMAIMVYYLKNLSTGLEPGMSEDEIRFATVITAEVSKEDREAMLRPLQLFVDNFKLPIIAERMLRGGTSIREGRSRGLRKFSLIIWELKGSADTWREQLEEHYKKTPAFALLGGITTGEWAPIHHFCEEHEIPAIFPITNFPVISDKDWYTLYLSKGYYLEGEAAAQYLHTQEKQVSDQPVVQVFRKDRSGAVLSRAFQDTWTGLGRSAPVNIELGTDQLLSGDLWKTITEKHEHAVIVLWLGERDFTIIAGLAQDRAWPRMIIASSSLLGKTMYSLPDKARASVHLTYPYTLPRNAGNYKTPLVSLLKNGEGAATGSLMDYKMQTLRAVASGPFSRMRSFVYREFFLELIDAMADLSVFPVPYPRMSFGPGQRYASKGCYVVQLSEGPDPQLMDKSGWITY
jgi:hypothetical protein